jgi:hypothetical protein
MIQRRLYLAHRGTVADVAPYDSFERPEQRRPTMRCAATK